METLTHIWYKMYAYIKGTLIEATPGYVILESGGIGYKILIPSKLLGTLSDTGCECRLFTSFVIRENSQTLFGFQSAQEKDLFELLITFSGVGPKTGLSILSHLSSEELSDVVLRGESKELSKVPGIGKKTAERLLIDLKGKLTPQSGAGFAPASPTGGLVADAIAALQNLGYSSVNAQKAVSLVLKEEKGVPDLSILITKALKNS
jgi:holliday junction DNA helicase RuvA